MFQCHADTDVRAQLIAHCRYSEEDELARLQAEFPHRIGHPHDPARYWLGKSLGAGGYARVYTAYDSVRGERLACKIQKVTHGPSQKREIVLQAALNHPSIVGLRDVVYAAPSGGAGDTGTIYIMMECMGGGELFKLIQRHKGLPEASCAFFFRQIMLGVAYCHSRGVCHRDLKLENVLLNDAGTAVKIADFGFAKDISNSPASSVTGTAMYVAPEQLDAQPYDGARADMWACGVILYTMREGQYPFLIESKRGVGEPGQHFSTSDTLALKEMLQAAEIRFKPHNPSSEAFQELVAHLLDPNPESRWSAAEVLQHPWTRGAEITAAEMESTLQAMDTDAIANPQVRPPPPLLSLSLPLSHSAPLSFPSLPPSLSAGRKTRGVA